MLIILIGVFGFVGFNGTTQISATCTDTYFATKFSSVTKIVEVCFVCSVLAILFGTGLFVTYLILLIRFFR